MPCPSPYGDIEYTENGAGPNVLVIHGAGDGFDQGELLSQPLLGNPFHVITPSRFEKGGHLVFATELPTIRPAVQQFILEHSAQPEALQC